MKATLDFNVQFKAAIELLENTNRNVFITGKAGTGKSTLLDYFRNFTKKNAVVLAPTGVAALNVKGQTIHSFFGFKPDITLESVKKLNPSWDRAKLFQRIQTLVIDEISMVRADLLDCMDAFLKLNGPEKDLSFGGVQIVFVGDLYQLPPVTKDDEREIFDSHYQSPYFFSAKCMEGVDVELLELQKIYRQDEADFINVLNAIRTNKATLEQIELLNSRFNPNFVVPEGESYIYLTTTNKMAEEVNNQRLNRLEGDSLIYQGSRWGEFDGGYLPTAQEIVLKVGAQVMLLNNDQEGRWVNGTIGKVVELPEDEEVVSVEINGKVEKVKPFTWELSKFRFDEESKSIVSEPVGAFTQYPLKLAWAVTIHKSQGKTFDKVVIDIGWGTFAHGQMYVALSRCTSLQGIVLKNPLQKRHIIVDTRINKFFQNLKGEEVRESLEEVGFLPSHPGGRSPIGSKIKDSISPSGFQNDDSEETLSSRLKRNIKKRYGVEF